MLLFDDFVINYKCKDLAGNETAKYVFERIILQEYMIARMIALSKSKQPAILACSKEISVAVERMGGLDLSQDRIHQCIGKMISAALKLYGYKPSQRRVPIHQYYTSKSVFVKTGTIFSASNDYSEKLVISSSRVVPNTIYHYTSVGKLEKILKSGSLLLSNTNTMNDRAEIRDYYRTVKEGVMGLSNNSHSDDIKDKCNDFFERHESELARHGYAASFSELIDDASQWRCYGDGGRGVVLAFDSMNLERVIRKASKNFGFAVRMEMIDYESDRRRDPIVKELLKYLSNNDYDKYTENEIVSKLSQEAIFHKHQSFASEREVRMAVPPINTADIEKRLIYKEQLDKEYIEIAWRDLCKKLGISLNSLLKRRIIGPNSDADIEIIKRNLRNIEPSAEWLMDSIQKSNSTLR